MRLIVVIFLALLIPAAYADTAPAIYCPVTITCNYETGVCAKPDNWILDAGRATEVFTGSQTMNLSEITAYRQGGFYHFLCSYHYGNYAAISIYTGNVRQLTGTNWVFSGFGNSVAKCSAITDPTTCAGA